MKEGEGAAAPGTGKRAKRILIVDDNRDAGETLTELLKASGYDCRYAADGFSALEEAALFAPDIAILDIGLPGMDGYTLAGRLRELAGGDHLSLIALSGYGEGADAVHAMEAGFDRHVTKPTHLSDLLAIINGLDHDRAE